MAGQPRTHSRDTLAGWRSPFEGTLRQHLVIPGVEVSEVMVAQGLHRFVHRWGNDNLHDGAIQGWLYLHLGGEGRRRRRTWPTGAPYQDGGGP